MIEAFMRTLATLAGIWMALAVAGFAGKLVWLALTMGWGLL